MKLECSRNAKKGILYGFINRIVLLLLPFIIQTEMIRMLGADYAGIKGLFSSILEVFNLAELGFGSAIVYSMYQPIADGKKDEICALLGLYKKIYQYIGLIILFVGMILIPFLPDLIKGSYPGDINLTIVYLMYLMNTVLSYWLFAYRTSIFTAFQRSDVLSKISTVTQGSSYIIQILILQIYRDYYLYLSVSIVCTIVNNLLVYYFSNRLYPEYKCKGSVDKAVVSEIKEKVSGLMIYKICGTTRNSFDSIFVSMFLGLTSTAMYSNYFYVINAVSGIMGTVSTSLTAGIGNMMKLDSVEKNRSDMEKLDCLYMTISGWCMICIICLYQPFMEMWAGRELVFPFPIAVMFGVYFYIQKMGDIRALYADARGLWWENRYRTIAEAVLNVVLNYLFVRKWGVYGIIGATILTLLIIGFIGSAFVLYKHYFKKGLTDYFIQHAFYAMITSIVCIITYKVCLFTSGNVVRILVGRFIICCTIAPLIYILCYYRNGKFKEAFIWGVSRLDFKIK